MGKCKDSSYVSRRSTDWILLKCHRRQEFVNWRVHRTAGRAKGFWGFVVGGFDAAGSSEYAGKVGTEFWEKRFATLLPISNRSRPASARLQTLPISKANHHWVKPVLVAEVAFQKWTKSGRIRQAAHAEAPTISHAERVIDVQSGLSKGELVGYYRQVAHLIKVHLQEHPKAVMRAPDGVGGEFFQKHLGAGTWAGIEAMPAHNAASASAMLQCVDAQTAFRRPPYNTSAREYHSAL